MTAWLVHTAWGTFLLSVEKKELLVVRQLYSMKNLTGGFVLVPPVGEATDMLFVHHDAVGRGAQTSKRGMFGSAFVW